MRISVIPSDRTIVVNSVVVQLPADVPFPETDVEIEAIQWDGSHMHGTWQRKSGTTPFNDLAPLAPYIDAFHVELERRLDKQRESFFAMKADNESSHQVELKQKQKLDEAEQDRAERS